MKLKILIDCLKKYYPYAGTSLQYKNEWQFLVAVILSARSTDEQVNRVTPKLFNDYPDVISLAEASPDEVSKLIKGCGLYRNKSRNLVKLAQVLKEEYGGRIPPRWESLLSLPGVGRKTASLIWGTLFGYPAFPVDTHVYRVSRRLDLARGEKVEEVEQELKTRIPRDEWLPMHHRLIFHGRQLCLSRKPRCRDCFLQEKCPSFGIL